MEQTFTLYKAGSGQLKKYDEIWHVLDDKIRYQLELTKKDYSEELFEGMKIDYDILINDNDLSDRFTTIRNK